MQVNVEDGEAEENNALCGYKTCTSPRKQQREAGEKDENVGLVAVVDHEERDRCQSQKRKRTMKGMSVLVHQNDTENSEEERRHESKRERVVTATLVRKGEKGHGE